MKKSQLVGFLLTLFFGPIGLFYSSVPAALGFLIASVSLVFSLPEAGFIFAPIVWLASILASFFTVSSFNSKVAMEENRHQELLAAAREKQTEWDGAPANKSVSNEP